MLESVPEILEWDAGTTPLDKVETDYTGFLTQHLGAQIARLESCDPKAAASILQNLAAVEVEATRRVLLAPETSSRLLWGHPGACDERDLWRYLRDTLELEQRRAGGGATNNSADTDGWSALGDFRSNGSTGLVQQPRPGNLTLDTQSPAALCFDYSALHGADMRLQHYRDGGDRDLAVARLEAAMTCVDDVSASIGSFARQFTLVANLVVDGAHEKFTSGSTGQYIGRSMFCNAHLPFVDVAMLTDAVVHEAIHSLLYMQEVREPWVLHNELFSGDPVVESPWTGTALPIRPFLQACFVWYGLANFWSKAQTCESVDSACVERHLSIARNGFLKGSLIECIERLTPAIADDVLLEVDLMQGRIVDSVSAAAG